MGTRKEYSMRTSFFVIALFLVGCGGSEPDPGGSTGGGTSGAMSKGGDMSQGGPSGGSDGGSATSGGSSGGPGAPCGLPGLACCGDGSCVGSSCDGTICLECGGLGEPCCAGSSCDGAFECVDQLCQPHDD